MSHVWVRHVTHVDAACHPYGFVILHILMGHVTHGVDQNSKLVSNLRMILTNDLKYPKFELGSSCPTIKAPIRNDVFL